MRLLLTVRTRDLEEPCCAFVCAEELFLERTDGEGNSNGSWCVE